MISSIKSTLRQDLRTEWNQLIAASYSDVGQQQNPGGLNPNDTQHLNKQNAYKEHRGYSNVPFFASLDTIEREIGYSARWYFTFGNTLVFSCIVMIIFAWMWYACHLYYLTINTGLSLSEILLQTENPFLWLTIVYMEKQTEPYWWVLLCVVWMTCVGYPWLYCLWVNRHMEKHNANNIRLFDKNTIDDRNRGRVGRGTTLTHSRQHQAIDTIDTIDSWFLLIKRALHDRWPLRWSDPDIETQKTIQQRHNMSKHDMMARFEHEVSAVDQSIDENSILSNIRTLSLEKDDEKQSTIELTQLELTVLNPPLDKTIALDQRQNNIAQVQILSVDTGTVITFATDNYVDNVATDTIINEQRRQKWLTIHGWLKSIFLTIMLLGVFILINYYFYIQHHHFEGQLPLSATLSVLLAIANGLGQVLSRQATDWENHQYRSTHHTSFLIKTYLFRMAATIIMFCFSQFTVILPELTGMRPTIPTSTHGLPGSDCAFVRLGEQYMMVVLTELITGPIPVGLCWFIQNLTQSGWYRRSGASENRIRPEFSFAEEYSDLLYKLFLVYVGMPIFPALAAGMLIVILLEVHLWDRLKLKLFVRPIQNYNYSLMKLLPWLNLFNILLGTLVVPNGIAWIISAKLNSCHFIV